MEALASVALAILLSRAALRLLVVADGWSGSKPVQALLALRGGATIGATPSEDDGSDEQ